jgi:hypothetical protein
LGLAVLYAVFSGWGIPAQRTIWMLCLVTVLAASGRRWPWPQVWLAACAVVVLLDPWALGQAGFWLSFVAVGVLFATDVGAHQHSASASLAQRVWRLCREQWVLTLCLAPLTLLGLSCADPEKAIDLKGCACLANSINRNGLARHHGLCPARVGARARVHGARRHWRAAGLRV